ncbi:hypothetical protein U1Q18_014716, partial [Sarracenia purpurea var. burkii]
GLNDVAHLKELYLRNDPEAVIRIFESQPSLHGNPSALALRTPFQVWAENSQMGEESICGLSAFRNVRKATKDGVLGTASAPLHMVTSEGEHLKEQLWRTFCTLGMAFLLISGVGALIADRGISKGTTVF